MTLNVIESSSRFAAARIGGVAEFFERATKLKTVTPFQTEGWLGPWFSELAPAKGVQPLLISVTEVSSGQIAMLLPLCYRRVRGLALIEFPDLSVADYNFPILGPAAPRSPEAAASAWCAAVQAMPRADLVRFSKMPVKFDGETNTLALLGTRPAPNLRNSIALPGTWDELLKQRSGHFRKSLRQKQKGIQAGGATFQVATNLEEALAVLSDLTGMQAERMRSIGETYVLDQPEFVRFYNEVLERGIADGTVLLPALRAGGKTVAVALCLIMGTTCIMIRLANAGGQWGRHSPAIVLISETMRWLQEQGITTFDMGVGSHEYKVRVGCVREELHSFEYPLSSVGRLAAIAVHSIDKFRDSKVGNGMVARWHMARSNRSLDEAA
jgi:CelD/BcsL family acetyltransferase involved in cellulose biosynthesis